MIRLAELLLGLGALEIGACPPFDTSGNGAVEIGEIIAGVRAALLGYE